MATEVRLAFVTELTRFTVPPVDVTEVRVLSVTGVEKFSVPADALIDVPDVLHRTVEIRSSTVALRAATDVISPGQIQRAGGE